MDKIGKELALILPALTRWTSHYLSVRRLLALKTPIGQLLLDRTEELELCAGSKLEAQEKAKRIIRIIRNPEFWENLQSIQLHLEPLAKAANVTQSDCARLDVVLITLANLHHYYSSTAGLNQAAATAVLASLEKRWANADQDIFILALVFNPYVRVTCFARTSPFRTAGHVRRLAEGAFHRFYATAPGADFGKELVEYLHAKGHWSHESMNLKDVKDRAKAEDVEVNLITIWREWTPIDDNGDAPLPSSGAGRLALLATRILSMVPNSAAVERIFSVFGIVHSKLRNRLGKDKIRKTVVVRVDTSRRFGSGVSYNRKRKFGADSDDEDDESTAPNVYPRLRDEPAEMADGTVPAQGAGHVGASGAAPGTAGSDEGEERSANARIDYMAVVRDLLESDEGEEEPADIPASTSGVPRDSPDRKLKNLFSYPSPAGNGPAYKVLTHYWRVGERNLEREAQFHDEVHSTQRA